MTLAFKVTRTTVNRRADATELIQYDGEIDKKQFRLRECFDVIMGTLDGETISPFSIDDPGVESLGVAKLVKAMWMLDDLREMTK